MSIIARAARGTKVEAEKDELLVLLLTAITPFLDHKKSDPEKCREPEDLTLLGFARLLEGLLPLRNHDNGRFPRLFLNLVLVDLLILDDWGPDRFTASERRDLMEIVEDRYGRRSTIITSQLPVEACHADINEPTLADAILDRIVHNAYRFALDGPSLRRDTPPDAPAMSAATDEEPGA